MSQISKAHFKHEKNFRLVNWLKYFDPILKMISSFFYNRRKNTTPTKRGFIACHIHIGDALMMSGSVAHLVENTPDMQWYVLTSKSASCVWNGQKVTLIEVPDRRSKLFSLLNFSTILRLNRLKFDVVLSGISEFESVRNLFRTYLGVVLIQPRRFFAYSHKGMGGLVSHPMAMNEQLGFSQSFARTVATFLNVELTWSLAPKIFLSDDVVSKADRIYQSLAPANEQLVAFFPYAITFNLYWSYEDLAFFIEHAQKMLGRRVVVFGSKRDANHFGEVKKLCKSRVEEMFGGNIIDVIALLKHFKCAIGPDSGGRFMAAAAGIPAIFFYRPGHYEIENHQNEFDCPIQIQVEKKVGGGFTLPRESMIEFFAKQNAI